MSTQYLIYSLALLLCIVACASEPPPNQRTLKKTSLLAASHKAAKANAQNIFSNSHVEVKRVDLSADEAYFLETTSVGLVYGLSDCYLGWAENESKQGEVTIEENRVRFHIAGKHQIHNRGRKGCSFLLFEHKEPPESTCSSQQQVDEFAERFAEVLFENQYFQVSKTRLEPGIELPLHRAQNGLNYALSSYQIVENDTLERALETGDLYWAPHCISQVHNAGHTRAEWLQVQLK